MAKKQDITIDLNKITRREFREFIRAIIEANEFTEEADLLTGDLASKVITGWPYEQPITQEGYMELGLADSRNVDEALKKSLGLVAEKN